MKPEQHLSPQPPPLRGEGGPNNSASERLSQPRRREGHWERCAARRHLIFLGAFLLFLTFFKGDGGYHDPVNYLDDAEGLWLRGDMSRPDEIDDPSRCTMAA